MNKKYLINKLSSELILKTGYISIPPQSYVGVHPSDLEDSSIRHAVVAGWVDVSDDAPVVNVVKKTLEVEVAQPYEGLTEAELKAELAAKAEKAKEKEQEAAESVEAPDAPLTKTRKTK